MMTVLVVLGGLCISALLIFSGSVAIERKAERWERYEQWFHPPNDDDGINVVKQDEDTR